MPQKKEFYHDVDLKANQLFNSRVHNITTASRTTLGASLSTGDKGYVVYDTDILSPFFWDGTQWQQAGGASVWGSITGTLTNQTDLTTYLSTNYYPLSSNPAGYLTEETDPVFTDWLAGPPNISIFNNDSGYITSSSLNNYVPYTGANDNVDLGNNYIQSSGFYTNYNSTANGLFLTSDSIEVYKHGSNGSKIIAGDSKDLGWFNRVELTSWDNTLSSPVIQLVDGDNNKYNIYRIFPGDDNLQYNIALPNAGGTIPLTVNGQSADSTGAITIPIGTGTVTAVTASSPLASSGGATPNITIQQASGSQGGYLSSTDWTTFNTKEPAITAGTTSQYWRGDKTWQTFPTIPTVTPSALTKTDDTNVTLTLTGTPNTALLQSVNLALGWTGTLADSRIASASTWNAKQDALVSGTNIKTINSSSILGAGNLSVGTVTSVGLSMPSAFTVTNSPVTSSGTLAVTGAGLASQYIRGDGTLADFPTTGGGGSSVIYYLNGSVNQGIFSGNTYYQLSKTAITTTGTDFTIAANGIIARFITDANDPGLLSIPGGNFNFEFYFSASSNGGTPSFYINVYKYNGTFTLLGSNSTAPEVITNGTVIDSYYTSVTISTTTLTVTDRLAIEIYVTNSGRTITMHTEDNHVSEIITTFSRGLNALNGLTAQVQYFGTPGTTGIAPNWSSVTDTHTLNIPLASASSVTAGLISNTDYSTFNGKQNALSGTGLVKSTSGTISYITDNSTNWDSAYTNRISSLTVTGNSGAATLISNTLNIPTYTLSGLGGQPQLSGTGFVKASGTTISYDSSTYLTTISGLNISQLTNDSGYITSSALSPYLTSATAASTYYPLTNPSGYTNNTGTVISVGGTGTVAGLSLSGTVTTSGNLTLSGTLSTPISTINDSTTVGQNLVKLTNPSAITFLRVNADNTVSTLDAATFRTAIGAGTSSTTGTVTSVAALTLGTSGTDLSSTVATGTTTPVITLNVPDASATARGVITTSAQTIAGAKTFSTAPVLSSLTASQILATDASKNIQSLDTATYPSLTELSYVKGVTSAIQTQISGKQASGNYTTDDLVILGQQALGSTVKSVGLGCRSWGNISSAYGMVSQQLLLTAVYVPFATTITGVKWFQIIQGVYTASNYNGVGLYSYSGGTLTLVASSTDDGNIWKGSVNSNQSKAFFSSPYSAAAGVYYIGAIYSSSAQTTAPQIGAATAKNNGGQGDFTNSARINTTLLTQTSLTTPITISSTSATIVTHGFFLY